MPPPKEFARRISLRGDQVTVGLENRIRVGALAADQRLVLATPVDSGRARANWLPSLDAPKDGLREPQGEDPRAPGSGPNAQAVIEEGKAVIRKFGPGQTFHVTNSVPYINFLNEGSSAQAPEGFIDKAIQAAVRAMFKIKVWPPATGGRRRPRGIDIR